MLLTLDGLRRAWQCRDPELAQQIVQLSNQVDPLPATPTRSGVLTFRSYTQLNRDPSFQRKPKPEQAVIRRELLQQLESPTAEVPLSDQLKLHEIVWELWKADEPYARTVLLDVIADVRLTYGPWRALKRIYKESEASGDTEIYGALAASLDHAYAGRGADGITRKTLAYLVRRAWRYLRRTAIQLPATYADVAVDCLIHYPDDTNWRATWIANHIFFHETKKYGRTGFQFGYREQLPTSNLKHRAYPELWQRTPRPLFSVLERARSDAVREFAAACLKADFRASLRDVQPVWITRLIGVQSKAIDDFVIWLLQNVPTLEQAGYRTNGLHQSVLKLLASPSDAARVYAAKYARTHARDLPVSDLVLLANNSHEAVRKLAQDLLSERDPRTDVGLAAWGELLETQHGYAYAAKVIPQFFGVQELTPDWFADRLLSPSQMAFDFAKNLLPKTHPTSSLSVEYYFRLIQRLESPTTMLARRVLTYAAPQIATFDLNDVSAESLRWYLMFETQAGMAWVPRWIDEGKLRPQTLGIEFLKALAFRPDWDSNAWLTNLRLTHPWAQDLTLTEKQVEQVLGWFADVRKVSATELGFDWLMRLVARSEPHYHDFAVDRMIRSFSPADFAPTDLTGPNFKPTPGPVDFQRATFLFTGKMATMKREEAESRVKASNGVVAGSVTKNLHYLVIGDEGSPFYGQGAKGAKQTKAEQLNQAGTNIRIISETMFLQMLVGQQPKTDTSAVQAGCLRLWELAMAPGPADAPVGKFARQYLRKHHPILGPLLTDRPVDPGTEIPLDFLTYDRVAPLLAESRRPLREFALDLARWEFARWNPTVDQLVSLCELPFPDVRRFVSRALLADDTPENRPFRLDPTQLEPSAAYRFCEAADEETRALGMELIQRLPKLRLPEELFRLSESPDRLVRAFVIRSLWSVYRDRGVTPDWKPRIRTRPTIGNPGKMVAEKRNQNQGSGVPQRPEGWPAPNLTLAQFLRRVLFEIPPGPPPPATIEPEEAGESRSPSTPESTRAVQRRSLPARRAKIESIETMRDLALEDRAFASGILPLLDEFLLSRGVSERSACLVALTRIRHTYPELRGGAS